MINPGQFYNRPSSDQSLFSDHESSSSETSTYSDQVMDSPKIKNNLKQYSKTQIASSFKSTNTILNQILIFVIALTTFFLLIFLPIFYYHQTNADFSVDALSESLPIFLIPSQVSIILRDAFEILIRLDNPSLVSNFHHINFLRNNIFALIIQIKKVIQYFDDHESNSIYSTLLYRLPEFECSQSSPALLCDNIIGKIRTFDLSAIRFIQGLDSNRSLDLEDYRLLINSGIGLLTSHFPHLIDNFTSFGISGDSGIEFFIIPI
jgi:hypothetical protein